MKRDIYHPRPATTGAYFFLAIKTTLLAYVGTIIIYLLNNSVGTGLEGNSGVLSFFYGIFSPVTLPVFAWAGLHDLSVNMAGLYTIFLLMFTPALLNAIHITRVKLEQIALLDEAYGPLKKPEHQLWFFIAFFLFSGAFFLRQLENNTADTLTHIIVNCTRLLAPCILFTSSICMVIIGWRMRSSWLKSPEAATLPPKKKKPTQLRVAVDNSTLQNAAAPAIEDNGLYVALTAELIQAAGRSKAMPQAAALCETLAMLQKAAQMTRSNQFSHPDLAGLCEKTCTLFAQGRISHLPDLKAALAIYKRADPARLMEIAAELKKLHEAH